MLFAISLAAATMLGLPANAQSGEKFTFIAVSPPSIYMLPTYVAQEEGFYKSAGLDFEIKTVGGDQNGVRALLTGAGQVAILGPPGVYEAVIHGAKIKVIGGGNQILTDYFLVLGKGKGTTLKDAANKTIAISNPGSMPQVIPEMMFSKAGIDASKTKYVSVGGMSARLQAVAAGKVDGTLIDALTSLRGEREGVATIVADANVVLGGPLGYNFTITTQEQLDDPAKRKALYAFVKQTMRGARFIVDQPEMAAKIMDKQLKGDVPLDLLKETVQKLNSGKVWGLNGGVGSALHDFTIQSYLKFHAISKSVDYKDAFDPTLADQAVKELGTREGWQ
jgi:ABC-type nitrate/sulfonate/bicarbonate transport system substrate-binding protein